MGSANPQLTSDPLDFLASVSDKIDGFLYRCLNNSDYTMLRLTSGFDRMFERSSAEMVLSQQSFANLIHWEDLEVIRVAVERALKEDRRWRIAYRFRHANERWIWVYETGGGVRDPATGKIEYLDGVVLDVNQFEECLAAKGRNLAADFT
ncbi:MAG: PAS domain-containing protein [Terricaulis sp.]